MDSHERHWLPLEKKIEVISNYNRTNFKTYQRLSRYRTSPQRKKRLKKKRKMEEEDSIPKLMARCLNGSSAPESTINRSIAEGEL